MGCKGNLEAGENLLCTWCVGELSADLGQGKEITDSLVTIPGLSGGWTLLGFRQGGIVQNILHELKYHHKPEIGVELGKVLGSVLKQKPGMVKGDLIIPVPLHRRRQLTRGYNQSACIARGLSAELSIPVKENFLVRRKATKTQTRKSRFERWLNVKSAFQVKNPAIASGRDVILVDDVVTTGSTLESCAQACREAGAGSITILCLASARY